MASPNSTFTEIVTTTLRNRSGKTTDNVSSGNAILSMLKKQGRVADRPRVGRSCRNSNTRRATSNGIRAARPSPSRPRMSSPRPSTTGSRAASSVSISGLEKDVQNTGKEALINLMEARIKNAERTMKNQVTNGMYSDGTGNSGQRKSAGSSRSSPTTRPRARRWAASTRTPTRGGATRPTTSPRRRRGTRARRTSRSA